MVSVSTVFIFLVINTQEQSIYVFNVLYTAGTDTHFRISFLITHLVKR